MAINIKNDETERLTREVTELTGEGVTAAVTTAVRERLQRVRRAGLTIDQWVDKILGLGRQIAVALGPNPMQIEDRHHDATGLPA